MKKDSNNDQEFKKDCRYVYWLLLNEMDKCARENGSKFVTMCLEDEKEFLQLQPIQPTSFPYFFATSGREGEPDSPKFHVGRNMSWHPIGLVHTNWAKHIRALLDKNKL